MTGIFLTGFSMGQSAYWQQALQYRIDVSLNDKDHTLDGFLKLAYTNHSPDTLRFIWFHLWPNAYKNDKTAFSEQLLENGRTDFYFSRKEQRGYINRLDFRVENSPCKTEDHPQFIDVVKVVLPQPLAPGASTTITTPFHVQLPEVFSRGGHKDQFYLITQWYPKPAVYDKSGWHPMPYLDQGEFYSEFGNFDVRITVPANYVVAAPGILQNPEEKEWLAKRSSFSLPVPPPAPKKKWGEPVKKIPETRIASATATKTLQYLSNNVHDFAWFADKNFVVNKDTAVLPSGKVVELYSFYSPKNKAVWANSTALMKRALHFRSGLIGEYPYPTLSAVEGPMGFDGGMEYPGITSISPMNSEDALDNVLEHEIGHNWFYGILASNERQSPWMDEGINSYYDKRYERRYQHKQAIPVLQPKENTASLLRKLNNTLIATHQAQAITTTADSFTTWNYMLVAYEKTAEWMEMLEQYYGTTLLDSCMQQYFREWQFRHPQPEDLLSLLEKSGKQNLTEFRYALRDTRYQMPAYAGPKKTKLSFLADWKADPKTRAISVLPIPGYNKYDGIMLGIGLHNFNIPPTPFRFFIAPQFGFRSKALNGIGRLQYSLFPEGRFRKIDVFLNADRYSLRTGIDSNQVRLFGNFAKFVPGIRMTFREPNLRSNRERFIEWKTYLIRETGFNYVMKSTDSVYYPATGKAQQRYINQLTYGLTSYRILYPYSLRLQLQQGQEFYRLNVTGNYFFNYPRSGGLSLRVFASKFGYIGGKTSTKSFNTLVYQPKLTAVRGEEDYTYSDYFSGRAEQTGGASQQIMLRDGGLKIRTDLFQDLQGRSDNWIAAANFSTTIPESVLPKLIPLRLFLDVGTYADAWKQGNSNPRFLYVGGLQLSLFNDIVNIYAPLLYSKNIRDNLKTVPEENKFLRKISFTIDLSKVDLRRISGNKFPF